MSVVHVDKASLGYDRSEWHSVFKAQQRISIDSIEDRLNLIGGEIRWKSFVQIGVGPPRIALRADLKIDSPRKAAMSFVVDSQLVGLEIVSELARGGPLAIVLTTEKFKAIRARTSDGDAVFENALIVHSPSCWSVSNFLAANGPLLA